MYQAVSPNNRLRKGGKVMKTKLIVLFMVVGMALPGLLPAAEILTEEDFK